MKKSTRNHLSPRVLNSHLIFDEMPKDYTKFHNKIIYFRRNLKDIAVSFYNHTLKFYDNYQYKGEWKNYLKMVLDGRVDYNSWFDFVLHWEEVIATHPDLRILELTYEDMIECPHREFKKIAEFLEVPFDDKLLADVVQKCSFKCMKERKGHFYLSPEGDSAVYRKGEVGDWKNWFTVAQNEWFDRIYGDIKIKVQILKIGHILFSFNDSKVIILWNTITVYYVVCNPCIPESRLFMEPVSRLLTQYKTLFIKISISYC
ncbi:sulfotransferase 1B1 [Patella vulgata]|uniref:sulfotransferase 1B1 n=1 Tax=Patella vulgata TaxID=6465 RepID=UPI00217FACF6|nr:sulfotransferase 1B1 [Patella vulgata]